MYSVLGPDVHLMLTERDFWASAAIGRQWFTKTLDRDIGELAGDAAGAGWSRARLTIDVDLFAPSMPGTTWSVGCVDNFSLRRKFASRLPCLKCCWLFQPQLMKGMRLPIAVLSEPGNLREWTVANVRRLYANSGFQRDGVEP